MLGLPQECGACLPTSRLPAPVPSNIVASRFFEEHFDGRQQINKATNSFFRPPCFGRHVTQDWKKPRECSATDMHQGHCNCFSHMGGVMELSNSPIGHHMFFRGLWAFMGRVRKQRLCAEGQNFHICLIHIKLCHPVSQHLQHATASIFIQRRTCGSDQLDACMSCWPCKCSQQ